MRTSAFFAAIFILLSPLCAAAATPPLDTLCKGNTGNPSDAGALFDQSGDASIMDTFLKKKVLCPSACFDISLTISVVDKKLKIVTTAVDTCLNPKPDLSKIKSVFTPLDKPNDTRNCASGKGLPSITATTIPLDSGTVSLAKTFGYSIPDALTKQKTVGPKSRCDQNVSDVIASFTSNGNNGLDVGLNKLAGLSGPTQAPAPDTTPAPDAPATSPTPQPASQPAPEVAKPPTVPTDSEALAQLLQDKYKVPEDQAKSLVENNPDQVKSMIEKSLSNDTAGAQEIAKQLKLNDDTMKSIAEMTPPTQMTAEEAKRIADQQTTQQPNTFDQPQTSTGLPTQCGVEGLAGNIMRAESSCGRINSNPLSSVQGPYHFLCGTWQAYANSTGNGQYSDCAYRNDPTISTMVMNAKMDQFGTQYGSQCTQAGLSLTSCQYAIHVFGETGFKNMYNAYLNSPNDSAFSLCGSALGNSACSNNASIFRNGGTIAGVFGELDKRLGGNGTVITGIASNGSPFSGVTGGGGVYTGGGSPFGGASFFNFGTGVSQPTGYSTSGGSPVTSFFTGMFSGLMSPQTSVQPTQNQVQYPAQQTQGVASIIAQPTSTYVGGNVLISWSSVGTRTDQQCQTNMYSKSGTTTIATGNEGSKVVTAATSGRMSFTIMCTTYAGTIIAQSTNVQVQ